MIIHVGNVSVLCDILGGNVQISICYDKKGFHLVLLFNPSSPDITDTDTHLLIMNADSGL